MSTLDIRDLLDGISEACSMKVYFYIWNLTWIWRIEETTKYCEVLGDLLFLLLFIYWCFMGSCAALRWFCTRIWIFSVLTISYLRQPVCLDVFLYICIYSTSFCMPHLLICVCYSACFHTINFYAFVFRTLPSLLLLLIDRRPPWSSAYPLSGGGTLPMPYHRSFNNLFITFFLFIIHFVFLFYFKYEFFIRTSTVRIKVAKTAQSELRYFVVPSAAVGKY